MIQIVKWILSIIVYEEVFFSQFFVFLLLSYMICGLCYLNMTICQPCYDVLLYMSDLNNKIESIK